MIKQSMRVLLLGIMLALGTSLYAAPSSPQHVLEEITNEMIAQHRDKQIMFGQGNVNDKEFEKIY